MSFISTILTRCSVLTAQFLDVSHARQLAVMAAGSASEHGTQTRNERANKGGRLFGHQGDYVRPSMRQCRRAKEGGGGGDSS